MEIEIKGRDYRVMLSGAGVTLEKYTAFRELAIEFMQVALEDPPRMLQAGIRLASLTYDDPVIAFCLCCRDVLGADCPENPFKAGNLAIEKILSCNPDLSTQ